MSLSAASSRISKKSDLPGKITYQVFIDTSDPLNPVVLGDPSASVRLGTIVNAPVFYLQVPGYYEIWDENPIVPLPQNFSPWVSCRGTIISSPANFLANSGSVVFYLQMPVEVPPIVVPNNYTVFSFMCVNPVNGNGFVPDGGISLNIEILEGPLAVKQVSP